MTREREEEIIKASQLYAKPLQKPFLDGARWADAHNEGLNMHIKFLKEELIDKACEWLYQHLYTVVDKEYPARHHVESTPTMGEFITQTEFVELFKKAMEQ